MHPGLGEACFWAKNGGGGLKNVKKSHKMTKKRRKKLKKAEKTGKKRKNDTFLCKKAHKFAHPIQMHR